MSHLKKEHVACMSVRAKTYTLMFCKPGRNVKVKVKFTLEQASKLSWGWVFNAMPRPLYPGESDPVSIV
jgi:hypothetical protein